MQRFFDGTMTTEGQSIQDRLTCKVSRLETTPIVLNDRWVALTRVAPPLAGRSEKECANRQSKGTG